ncbi:MAG: methyltransferase [Nocardiaceae bacterium]|nr:methyltransferase [Nocardiaceae bacterium]
MTQVLAHPIWKHRIFRLPTVYRPQDDSFLLIRSLAENPIVPGSRVLDMCTGSGVLALAASRFAPRSIVAVDLSWRAVLTARINAAIHGVDIEVVHGQLEAALARGPFDVVLSNPPYVPCADETEELRSRNWDAGPRGRLVLDPLCDAAPALLTRGGFMLMVQSEFSGERASLDALERRGLASSVVARERVPFGPVLRSRHSSGCLPPRQHPVEELVVIRADKTTE